MGAGDITGIHVPVISLYLMVAHKACPLGVTKCNAVVLSRGYRLIRGGLPTSSVFLIRNLFFKHVIISVIVASKVDFAARYFILWSQYLITKITSFYLQCSSIHSSAKFCKCKICIRRFSTMGYLYENIIHSALHRKYIIQFADLADNMTPM